MNKEWNSSKNKQRKVFYYSGMRTRICTRDVGRMCILEVASCFWKKTSSETIWKKTNIHEVTKVKETGWTHNIKRRIYDMLVLLVLVRLCVTSVSVQIRILILLLRNLNKIKCAVTSWLNLIWHVNSKRWLCQFWGIRQQKALYFSNEPVYSRTFPNVMPLKTRSTPG